MTVSVFVLSNEAFPSSTSTFFPSAVTNAVDPTNFNLGAGVIPDVLQLQLLPYQVHKPNLQYLHYLKQFYLQVNLDHFS